MTKWHFFWAYFCVFLCVGSLRAGRCLKAFFSRAETENDMGRRALVSASREVKTQKGNDGGRVDEGGGGSRTPRARARSVLPSIVHYNCRSMPTWHHYRHYRPHGGQTLVQLLRLTVHLFSPKIKKKQCKTTPKGKERSARNSGRGVGRATSIECALCTCMCCGLWKCCCCMARWATELSFCCAVSAAGFRFPTLALAGWHDTSTTPRWLLSRMRVSQMYLLP